MTIHLPSVADCRPIEARTPDSENTESRLSVFENGRQMPFPIERVFLVHADRTAHRGHHAHLRCSQALICVAGTCDVIIDDGRTRRTVTLSGPSRGILVPAGIWAEQRYRGPGTILMVLCDMRYDEADYIRDYDAFLRYRTEFAPAPAALAHA